MWWCVILYFYTATCGPKGHGSGLPLPRGNGGFFEKTYSCPRSKRSILVGHPFPFLP